MNFKVGLFLLLITISSIMIILIKNASLIKRKHRINLLEYLLMKKTNRSTELYPEGRTYFLHDFLDTLMNSGIHVNLIPSASQLEKMNHQQLAELFQKYMNNFEILCHQKSFLGSPDVGGYEVCTDEQFQPHKPCLVYSFGIHNNFSFDAMQNKYSCEIHCFSPGRNTKGSSEGKQNVTFHKLKLANYNGNKGPWKMLTLNSIKAALGHEKKILDILKIDIEDWKWKAVLEMITSGAMTSVRQFMVEFHMLENMQHDPDRNHYLHSLKTLKSLQELGFRVLWTERSMPCQHFSKLKKDKHVKCHNVLFGNIRIKE